MTYTNIYTYRKISTSHWPTQKIGLNNRPVVDPIDPQSCADEKLRLVGYSGEEIAALREV
jgi:hypothetical protein